MVALQAAKGLDEAKPIMVSNTSVAKPRVR